MRGAPNLSGFLFALAAGIVIVPPVVGQARLGPVIVGSGAAATSGPGGSAMLTLGQPVVGAAVSDTVTLGLGLWPGLVRGVPTPVSLAWFRAVWTARGAELSWAVSGDAADLTGFHVYRGPEDGARVRLTAELLQGSARFRFTDPAPPPGDVAYWLEERGRTGERAWHGPVHVRVPGPTEPGLALLPASPNPVRGSTRLTFRVPAAGWVRLSLFDQRGRLVRTLVDGEVPAGSHEATWTGRDAANRPVAAGIYFVRLETAEGTRAGKLAVLPRR